MRSEGGDHRVSPRPGGTEAEPARELGGRRQRRNVGGRPEHADDRRVERDAAVLQQDRAVETLDRQVGVVRHRDHCRASLPGSAYRALHDPLAGGVESGRRLIQQEQARPRGERRGERDDSAPRNGEVIR